MRAGAIAALGALVGLTGCLELVRRPAPETPPPQEVIQEQGPQPSRESLTQEETGSEAPVQAAEAAVPPATVAGQEGDAAVPKTAARALRGRRSKEDAKEARQINEYALWCIENGMWDEARLHLERALAQDSLAASFHNNLGIIYERMGQNDKAEASYQRALDLVPHKEQYAANLRRLEKRRRQARLDPAEEADSLAAETEDLYPLTEENEGGDTSQRTTP